MICGTHCNIQHRKAYPPCHPCNTPHSALKECMHGSTTYHDINVHIIWQSRHANQTEFVNRACLHRTCMMNPLRNRRSRKFHQTHNHHSFNAQHLEGAGTTESPKHPGGAYYLAIAAYAPDGTRKSCMLASYNVHEDSAAC